MFGKVVAIGTLTQTKADQSLQSGSNMVMSVSQKNSDWIDLILLEPESRHFLWAMSHSLSPVSLYSYRVIQLGWRVTVLEKLKLLCWGGGAMCMHCVKKNCYEIISGLIFNVFFIFTWWSKSPGTTASSTAVCQDSTDQQWQFDYRCRRLWSAGSFLF